jgi:hypothetical protein
VSVLQKGSFDSGGRCGGFIYDGFLWGLNALLETNLVHMLYAYASL